MWWNSFPICPVQKYSLLECTIIVQSIQVLPWFVRILFIHSLYLRWLFCLCFKIISKMAMRILYNVYCTAHTRTHIHNQQMHMNESRRRNNEQVHSNCVGFFFSSSTVVVGCTENDAEKNRKKQKQKKINGFCQ